ncbi:MAG: FAD-binding oxidoreductase [Dehalococcoidia bacterium]|nr:FAD-binding oxidoreductase [Dehalococcoidia bacterium]MDW8119572.1 FAD-dependent oxidoreductase [Chloroflexota bacterium]
MPPAGYDVVVLGAGAAGCAVAYYLTRQGVRPLLVERDALASHASGFALGGLAPSEGVFPYGDAYHPITRAAFTLHYTLHPLLQEETGISTEFRMTQSLHLALTEEQEAELRETLAWQSRHGFRVRWIDAQEARSIEPRLTPALRGAVHNQDTAMLDPYKLVLALVQAVEQRGGMVRHGEAVGLVVDKGQVRGVRLRSGEVIPCDRVVVALGPWMGLVPWLGIPVPVRPLKGQILRLRHPGPPLGADLWWGIGYAASKPDGLIWVGTTEEDIGFHEAPTPEVRHYLLEEAWRVLPDLGEAQVVLQTACLRPLSADNLPIIGPVPGLRGAYVAGGAGRKGILLCTAMGKAIADLITQGYTDIPIGPFGLERFAR